MPGYALSGLRSLPLFAALLSTFFCLASASAQVVPLPFNATGVTLSTAQPEVVFTVDLDTLPIRPRMITEVTPDAPFVDMEIEIELVCDLECFEFSLYDDGTDCNFNGDCTFCAAPGLCLDEERSSHEVYECSPHGSRAGTVCDVKVRAASFGGNGSPATVNVEIFAETVPPTDTQSFAYPPAIETATLSRDQDTTIYEDSINSNGMGEFIWAGREVTFQFPAGTETYFRNGLISFDIVDQFGAIPPGSTIHDVELVLEATDLRLGPISLRLDAVEENASTGLSSWVEGNANGAGDEFEGAFAFPGANWTHRGNPSSPWASPGGDFELPSLVGLSVSETGPVSFSSAALTARVQAMVDEDEDRNGFLLRETTLLGPNFSKGVQFASGEHPDASLRPKLIVDFSPPNFLFDVTLPFVDEGQNFRWIYDESPTDPFVDGVLTTEIGGQCTVDFVEAFSIPYTYDFGGDPAFQGLDCCTWQITAQGEPGTVGDEIIGTGQALFYINLDPLLPENQPGDLDADGIKDLCDNCMWRANGPLLGTCVGGAGEGITCNTNGECGTGGLCQLSQEDVDLDFLGDACLVPEPGFAWMLWSGVGLLMACGRSRLRS